MLYALAVLIGYLLGCSNMAIYLAKIKKVDLRGTGSGNPGASNATITMGWWAGVLTAVHDAGKALLAVWLVRWFLPELPYIDMLTGAACVLGHIFRYFSNSVAGKAWLPTWE